MQFETFEALFAMLAEFYGKRDENGLLCRTYYTLIMQSRPTDEEMFCVVSEFIDKRQDKFPSASEIKELLWQKRKQNIPALPANKEQTEKVICGRESKISFLRGVYKDQGDTPFYRGLFNAGSSHGVPLPFEKVTHQDVLNSMGVVADA